jgi:hypothetical protein
MVFRLDIEIWKLVKVALKGVGQEKEHGVRGMGAAGLCGP